MKAADLKIDLKCKTHPKYAAKRPPRAECCMCKHIWILKKINDAAVALEAALENHMGSVGGHPNPRNWDYPI